MISTNSHTRGPGITLALSVLLSTLGVVLVTMLCCGIPLLIIAAGVFGMTGALTGSAWMIIAAMILAAGLAAWLLSRRRREAKASGEDCCAPARSRGGSSSAEDLSDTVPASAPAYENGRYRS